MYRVVQPNMWREGWFGDLEADEQHVYWYLFTCPDGSACGAYRITPKIVANDTNIARECVVAILKKLATPGDDGRTRLTWWPELECIFVHDFYAHQRSNHNFETAAAKSTDSVPRTVQETVFAQYPEIAISYRYHMEKKAESTRKLERVSIPSGNGTQTPSDGLSDRIDTVSTQFQNGSDTVSEPFQYQGTGTRATESEPGEDKSKTPHTPQGGLGTAHSEMPSGAPQANPKPRRQSKTDRERNMERGIFETVGRRYVPNVNYRQQDFRDFIVAYPKGKSPFSAAIAWEQAQPTNEDVAMIMEVIGRYSGQTFTDEELVMIPAPEVFLNQTRWRDDEPFPGLVMCRRDARRADEEARRLRQAKDEVAPPPGKQFDLAATARNATSPDAPPPDPAAYGIVRQHDGNITPPKLKLHPPPAATTEPSAVAASSEA